MLDYKQVAVYKEQQLNNKVGRLKTLLYNTIIILEEQQVCDTHKRLLTDLGMTEKEYKEIMDNLKRVYFVEIQDIEDFDNILIQSPFLDSKEQAKQWFDNLEWFDNGQLTASVMSCEIDDEFEIDGDIDYIEELK